MLTISLAIFTCITLLFTHNVFFIDLLELFVFPLYYQCMLLAFAMLDFVASVLCEVYLFPLIASRLKWQRKTQKLFKIVADEIL